MYYYGICYDTCVKTFQKPGDTMTANSFSWLQLMSFSAKVIALRKERGLTQQGLADLTGIHIQQIKRYEAGTSEPSAEALRKIATSLHVTTDSLLFEDGERGPDDRLKLQFEALSHLDEKEREAVETVIASVLHMHDAKRWTQPATPAPQAAAKKKAPARRAGTRG
jgi:Predicted transcriptional regulators